MVEKHYLGCNTKPLETKIMGIFTTKCLNWWSEFGLLNDHHHQHHHQYHDNFVSQLTRAWVLVGAASGCMQYRRVCYDCYVYVPIRFYHSNAQQFNRVSNSKSCFSVKMSCLLEGSIQFLYKQKLISFSSRLTDTNMFATCSQRCYRRIGCERNKSTHRHKSHVHVFFPPSFSIHIFLNLAHLRWSPYSLNAPLSCLMGILHVGPH